MNNLLSNAVKYTREGDSITVRSWSVGPRCM
jgi:signal transduction histidine kinase